MGSSQVLTLSQCVTVACMLEATAPKPGNVHRGADFADLSFVDFLSASVAIAPAIASAGEVGVGEASLAAVRAMQDWTARNTSLGTILLLTPLAAVPRDQEIRKGISGVLERLTPNDSARTYQAIQLAQPGGLGKVESMDVYSTPPQSLRAAMEAAAHYDLVARQYTNDFHDVLHVSVSVLLQARTWGMSLTQAIIRLHLELLAMYPDSLIQRKCGDEVAQKASSIASSVLQSGHVDSEDFQAALADFDFWLRSDGNRRNPGTTADLVAATLFVCLREGMLQTPFR